MKAVPTNNQKEKSDSQYLDARPSDEFIDKTLEVFGGDESKSRVFKAFKGDKSQDFYLGVMAGLNIAMSAIHNFPVALVKDALMDGNIAAAISAKKKQTKIIS